MPDEISGADKIRPDKNKINEQVNKKKRKICKDFENNLFNLLKKVDKEKK
ncbi:MAG: hypothetical protein AABY32_01475 [Nanoarchaeota archaeon]